MTALDDFIREQGGHIEYVDGEKHVSFPDTDDPIYQAAIRKQMEALEAEEQAFEAACRRAEEYGTVVIPLRRSRGDGWYMATSHTYPGWGYVTQLDERTGEPVIHPNGAYCECDFGQAGGVYCHHNAAAHMAWRRNQPAILADVLHQSIAEARARKVPA